MAPRINGRMAPLRVARSFDSIPVEAPAHGLTLLGIGATVRPIPSIELKPPTQCAVVISEVRDSHVGYPGIPGAENDLLTH